MIRALAAAEKSISIAAAKTNNIPFTHHDKSPKNEMESFFGLLIQFDTLFICYMCYNE